MSLYRYDITGNLGEVPGGLLPGIVISTNRGGFMNDAKNAVKEDIEGIKKDIARLVQRLSNIQDKSSDILVDQLENLSSVMVDFKQNGMDKGKDKLVDICDSTRNHPLRNLAYAFGVGVILALLIK